MCKEKPLRRIQLAWRRMSQESSASLQEVLQRAERGDGPAREALFALLYDELHRLAHANVARARGAMTWNTTTLLHEAYLSLARREGLKFPDENRFLGYAARVMRGLTVDAARRNQNEKRGGRNRESLPPSGSFPPRRAPGVISASSPVSRAAPGSHSSRNLRSNFRHDSDMPWRSGCATATSTSASSVATGSV